MTLNTTLNTSGVTSMSDPRVSDPKKTVTITIDGKGIQAPSGENLLKIILEQKIAVPHYCYHPGLSVAGACRMCMVEISAEGSPAPSRPTIACNTMVTDGMVVQTATEKLKEIQKWNLAFHLINHPLDCPICDQAGECGLQDYYMKYGKYTSDMHEQKVLKRKVISIGKHVMLDTERCILCSRCVRFFDEVPKTSEMAIFKRGDRSEIGTYLDKDLNNNYTLNSVDICPVGALTSKDFRFKKRVWFLKEFDSICPGCSTGCNVKISQDPKEKRPFRMLPRHNKDVNGYWMCDYGRMRYKQTVSENRIQSPAFKINYELRPIAWEEAREMVSHTLKNDSSDIAVLVTPQYTCEETEMIYDFFHEKIKTNYIFHAADAQKVLNPAVIDELLLRDDKNPNSRGLLDIGKKYHLETLNLASFQKGLRELSWKVLFVFAPQDPESYPDFLDWFKNASPSLEKKILIGTHISHAKPLFDLVLPTLSFIEKEGTFINFTGLRQKISSGVKLIQEAKPVSEILCL